MMIYGSPCTSTKHNTHYQNTTVATTHTAKTQHALPKHNTHCQNTTHTAKTQHILPNTTHTAKTQHTLPKHNTCYQTQHTLPKHNTHSPLQCLGYLHAALSVCMKPINERVYVIEGPAKSLLGRTKENLWQKIFWIGMDRDIENIIQNRKACAATRPLNFNTPLQPVSCRQDLG